MAQFVPGGGTVAAISGKLGNVVFYRGRWGNTIRAWAYPVNTPSPLRTIYRGNFAALVSLFNTLTPAMKNDWSEYAHEFDTVNRLGARYIPTGLQQFITMNMNLLTCGLIPILIPNGHQVLLPIHRLSLSGVTPVSMIGSATLVGGFTVMPPDHYGVYAFTNNQVPHMRNKLNRYRIAAIVVPGQNLTGSIIASWLATWPGFAPVSGMRIFIKGHTVNGLTGEASIPFYTSALVV